MSNVMLPPNAKILIIGYEGQVATSLRSLLKDRVQLECTYFEGENPPENNAHFLDLSDLESIPQLISSVGPDVIINATAYTAVDRAESQKDQAYRINAEAPGKIAAIAEKRGSLFIHYSTDYVFDGKGHLPFTEESDCHPLNIYGLSKRQGEELILNTQGLRRVILRTSWVYSAYGQNFLKTMLRLGAEREELSVVNDQFGSPTSAGQIAFATLMVLKKYFSQSGDQSKNIFGLYHFRGQGFTTWYGFADYIFSVAREMAVPLKLKKLTPIVTQAYPTPAPRPLNSRLDMHKYINTFSHEPTSWHEESKSVLHQLLKPHL